MCRYPSPDKTTHTFHPVSQAGFLLADAGLTQLRDTKPLINQSIEGGVRLLERRWCVHEARASYISIKMAYFDGSNVPFDWHLRGLSFKEGGYDLSKSYGNVSYTSATQIREISVANIWGKNYYAETTLYGSFSGKRSSVTDAVVDYGNGELVVSDIKGLDLNDFGDNNLDRFNSKYLKHDDTIIGSENDDRIYSRDGDDYIWGGKGDDDLVGGSGDDFIVGGKGFDIVEGGSGKDTFGVSKKLGKGKKNWDGIIDFEVGKDMIYVDGSTKGLWINNYEGDAVLMRGKKGDIIAWVENAGGQLDWSTDGSFIM